MELHLQFMKYYKLSTQTLIRYMRKLLFKLNALDRNKVARLHNNIVIS